jgi:hypothetical protein
MQSLPRSSLLPASGRVLHSQNKVIKCAAYGVAQERGQRYGFININDMYNNDVGKGGVRVYEAYEVKYRVALVGVPFYFVNLLPTSLLYISILLSKVHRV